MRFFYLYIRGASFLYKGCIFYRGLCYRIWTRLSRCQATMRLLHWFLFPSQKCICHNTNNNKMNLYIKLYIVFICYILYLFIFLVFISFLVRRPGVTYWAFPIRNRDNHCSATVIERDGQYVRRSRLHNHPVKAGALMAEKVFIGIRNEQWVSLL